MQNNSKINAPINMYDPTRDYNNHKFQYDTAITTVLNHGGFINGPEINKLEAQLADYVGVKHCITVANGTDAIQIALMALDIKSGDEVITVPHTWISTAEAIAITGAKPVFVDIEPSTFNINTERIEKAITPYTKAILVVSLYGHMADIDKINEIAKKYNIPVIEDAAQSFGAKYKEHKSCSMTDISTTSFFPTKPLGSYGDGGACFTNNDILATKIKSIKNHGCETRFNHTCIGMNSRLDTLQASVLLVKLKYLDNTLQNRNNVANYYSTGLKNLEEKGLIRLPTTKQDYYHVWAQYSIIVKDNALRDKLVIKLKESNINVAIFYPKPLHTQKCFEYLEYKNNDFPVTEDICNRIINLPCYGELQLQEINYIIETFKNIINNY